jgi:hypothetical protein
MREQRWTQAATAMLGCPVSASVGEAQFPNLRDWPGAAPPRSFTFSPSAAHSPFPSHKSTVALHYASALFRRFQRSLARCTCADSPAPVPIAASHHTTAPCRCRLVRSGQHGELSLHSTAASSNHPYSYFRLQCGCAGWGMHADVAQHGVPEFPSVPPASSSPSRNRHLLFMSSSPSSPINNSSSHF